MSKLFFAVLLLSFAVPGYASTIKNLEGVVVEDVFTRLPNGYTPGLVIGDFNYQTTSPTLEFTDDTWLFGHVFGCCTDAFTIDLSGQIADLSFQAWSGWPGYKMALSISGENLNFSSSFNRWSHPVLFPGVTGLLEVTLHGQRSSTQWAAGVTNVHPVPVPAPLVLLLSGLIGLGWLGRARQST